MLRKLLNRFKEPSSLAGLSMLAVLFGVEPNIATAIGDAIVQIAIAGAAPTGQAIVSALGAVLAVAAVLVPEEKPPMLIVK